MTSVSLTAQNTSLRFGPWPFFAPDEIASVVRVLESGKVNYWTGDECKAFEQEYAATLGVRHAISLANGTLALELALRVLGIGRGDEVVTSSRTFIASASCAVMVGARPVCADVDPVSQNITAESIRRVLTPRTRAIIPVHLAGWPCDMEPILELAKEKDLFVIEDCAQAHGATYKGRPVGSFGDVAAFSFCQDKIITTGGEGGLLATSDDALWRRAWEFKDHGKRYGTVHQRQHPPGFRWLHESFGSNYRMTELQAAIGRSALAKLPSWVAARRRNAAILNEALKALPAVRITIPGPEIVHAYYKYYTFIRADALASGWSRDRIMDEIAAQGVPCFSGSCSEIYLERAFLNAGISSRRHSVAHELGETSLMFLVHPTIDEETQQRAAGIIRGVLQRASRA